MVVVVVIGRGGVGKIMMSVNFLIYFFLNGYKMFVIDGDLYFLKLVFYFGIYNFVINFYIFLFIFDVRFKDVIYYDVKIGVDVFFGSLKLFDIFIMDEKWFRDIVCDVVENYDVMFIDFFVGIFFDIIFIFRFVQYQFIIVEFGRCLVYFFRKMVENEVDKFKVFGEVYGFKVGVILNKVCEEKLIVDDIVEYFEESVGVFVVGIVFFDFVVLVS